MKVINQIFQICIKYKIWFDNRHFNCSSEYIKQNIWFLVLAFIAKFIFHVIFYQICIRNTQIKNKYGYKKTLFQVFSQ